MDVRLGLWRKLSAKELMLLDCKEIQPVHPKGNQSWIFIGRTDAETETAILWLPDPKNWLIGKDPDAGKNWRQEDKGTAEDEMVGWHHWLNGHEFEQAPGVGDGKPGVLQSMGSQRVGHNWATELNWMRKQAVDVVNGRVGQVLLVNATFVPSPLLYFPIYRNRDKTTGNVSK